MPRKKITLEDAFAIFEEHGLKVEVKGIQQDAPVSPLADFLEQASSPPVQLPQRISGKRVKITLYARHSIACAGHMVKDGNGQTHIEGNHVETYGPGIIVVPVEFAVQLLHQDGLARQGDEHMLDRKLRTYIVVPHGSSHRAIKVSEDASFDMSGFLGRLGDHQMYIP